jgi:nucleoside-diphosphate-sugar epimerase
MYVFGLPQGAGLVDESFPYHPYGGEYGRSKAAMERWCLKRAMTSLPTRIVILNPTCVFGPAGGAYTSLPVELARQGQFCWIDEGKGLCNYNYVDNLIDAMLVAAEVPEAHGNRFIINDGAISWREFFEPFVAPVMSNVPSLGANELRRLSRNPFKIRDLLSAAIDAPEVRATARRSAVVRATVASLRRFKRHRAPAIEVTTNGHNSEAAVFAPPPWLALLYAPAQAKFSARKAERILRWRPRVTLSEAQAATLRWLVEDGRLPEAAASSAMRRAQ